MAGQVCNSKDHFLNKRKGPKESKMELPKSEINYQALLEQIPAVTYMTALDDTGNRLYVSPQVEAMLGFPSSEWLTDPQLWFRQIHPDDRKRVLAEFYKSHHFGVRFRSEYRLIASDGHVVWVRDEAFVVKDEAGRPCFIQGLMFDISELLRTEEAFQKSEAKFRTIFEGTAIGIILVDTRGRLMESNPVFQKMLGYNVKEFNDKVLTELVHPDDIAIDRELYKKLLEGKQGPYKVEKRYIRKDGGVVWGRLNVSLVRSMEEKPQYTIHMVEDITEWKRLETEFLQSQKMETVGRLAGGIAHDLNNLFTVLSGYSQLSLIGLKEDDPLRENLQEIKKNTDRAAELTHQLLAISRRQILDMKVIELNHLIQGLEKMLRRIIGEDIELITHLAEGLEKVKVDPSQIEQVILNLVVNARDAMPKGGKLIIETQNKALDENYTHSHFSVTPGRYVILSVSDTGCGIPPGVIEKIFDPFFTTKMKDKGTGLGLSTVYGIIKQSGGYIWVYSEPGQGTTFKIYLPQVDEEATEVPLQQDEGVTFPRGSETILLVEDDHSLRGLTVRILNEMGYKVHEAANGGEAIKLARDHKGEKIHLLITDLVMPQMSGQEVVEQFTPLHPSAKLLLISGYLDSTVSHQALIKSRTHFLQKPFSLTDLAKKVRNVLDHP